MQKIQHQLTAGCFLIRKDRPQPQLLLIYKRWSGFAEGWVPPKGHVENNESLAATAMRETIEETGYIDIKIVKFLKTIQIEYLWHDDIKHQKEIHWFLAELNSTQKIKRKLSENEIKSTICQRWFNLPQALKLLHFDDEKEVLQQILLEKYSDKK
jgi:8-oxo-(d)GTP phosphatase